MRKKFKKNLFKSHRKTLEEIWNIGRGLIFAQHFSRLTGLKKAEMYREFQFLKKAGLLNIIKFNHQNIIQLTQFSTNQFQKKMRIVAMTNATILKHAFVGEILAQKFEQAMLKDINMNYEIFCQRIFDQTNFCRTEKVENRDMWQTLDKLRKRDTYCQASKTILVIYVFDIYNADARRIIERIAEIFEYLDDMDITEKLQVQFHICVVDEQRKRYLDGKNARRKFDVCLMGKHLVGRFSIKFASYDLTEKVFSHTRIVP